ncbi:MAG: hypothetical protein K8T25_14385 [Planctomycetia bacterium]|nr:hypothetical protein [Planctomycetia bacterium]
MELFPIEPWRCESISLEDYERESLKLAEFLDHLSTAFGKGKDQGEHAAAQRWREFHDSILPGDSLWLETGPASHPEVTHGSAYFLIVRNGEVVTRFLLYQP